MRWEAMKLNGTEWKGQNLIMQFNCYGIGWDGMAWDEIQIQLNKTNCQRHDGYAGAPEETWRSPAICRRLHQLGRQSVCG
eukprot:scaffold450026_cov39-Prasinocladus_malaysianus.AAC.1